MKRQNSALTFTLLILAFLLLGSGIASAATPGIDITSPKSSDVIVVGSTITVAWTWNGDPGPLKFDLVDTDGFVKYPVAVNIGKPQKSMLCNIRAQSNYNWSKRHKIVARSMNGNKVVGESDHFTIQAPEITASLPTRGTVWPAGVTSIIRWSPTNLPGTGKIELVRKSDNQAVQVITASVPFSQGSFNWTPSKTLPASYDGKEFFIRVWNNAIGTWGDTGSFKLDL